MRLGKRAFGVIVAIFTVAACTVKLPDYGPFPSLAAIDASQSTSSATRDASKPSSAGDSGPSSTGVTDDEGGADSGFDPGPPAIRYVGRFDTSDPAGPKMAWPDTRVIARFDGTSVTATLSQTDGFEGGPSYFDVVIDGTVQSAPISIEGDSKMVQLASGLAPGVHTVMLEKRTEANLGTVRFEGFGFDGGSGLLPPPASGTHLIEVMADSTIDGYGILGDRATCAGTDPPETNDSRQSFAVATADGLGADLMLSAYSGKGIQVNETPTDPDVYPKIWPRTLPENATSTWDFSKVPDAVVISLGGVDMDGLSSPPSGFQAAYDDFVGKVRAHYPNAYIWLLVWSQVKDTPNGTRTAYEGVVNAIASGRKGGGDSRIFTFVLPESSYDTDDTGCESHANAAHEKAMAALMVSEIKTRTGW
jgi:hypothetical protein